MSQINRRRFLRNTLSATAGSYLAMGSAGRFMPSVLGANDEIRVGVAGINSRGAAHINHFQGLPGVRVVALCDADTDVLAKRVDEFKKRNEVGDDAVKGYADVRKMLDNKDIDAIVIAAPNHWHSLMTIWACQAGKDVYVEKPVSHCIWEGRQMVKTARKYKRVVQTGTQQRSCPAVIEAAADIQAGKYGKVKWVHCSKLGARGPIGKVTTPQPVPENIDYNLWAGPAPMTPVMRKSFHYDWHWQWNWGDGEMANWGVHYLDDLHHLLGWKNIPTKVIAAGNRFLWDDNGQTPNMHLALMYHDGLPIVVDIRNLPDPERKGSNGGAVYLKSRGGNYIQCEDGVIRLSRGGGGAYDNDGNRIKQYKGNAGSHHAQNFIDCMRSRRTEDLAADIEGGHQSTAICHQANLAWRAGTEASVDEVRENLKVHDDALNTLTDMLEQMKGNKVDLKKESFVLGPELTFDRQQECFVGANADKANKFIKCSYRPGFEVPENV